MSDETLFKYVLIPFDGSPSSRKALDVGLGMAKTLGAKVALLSVEEYVPRFAGDLGEVEDEKARQSEHFARIQWEARSWAKGRGMDFDRADILVGHVAQTIIHHARAIGCDVIVMGHSGRSGVWESFLGTTAEKVSRHAPCTVVIVR